MTIIVLKAANNNKWVFTPQQDIVAFRAEPIEYQGMTIM